MMENQVNTYIDYIISLAGQQGYKLTPVRIVKFIYLADVYMKMHTDQRLTDWDWLFWDFGPFCVQSLDSVEAAANQGTLVTRNLPSKFSEDDYTLYSYPQDQFISSHDLEKHIQTLEKGIPIMVQMSLKNVVSKYGDSTSKLLNHVYYKTAPMQGAVPRTKLSFDSIEKPNQDKFVAHTVSKRKIKKAKELIAAMKEKMIQQRSQPKILSKYIDDTYINGMRALNTLDEDPDDINEWGTASIKTLVHE